MKEQFVPYEIALKLKEKGFMEECFGFYYYDGSFKKYRLVYEESSNDYLNSINAPLWQQVIHWIKSKGILITELWDGWEYAKLEEDFTYVQTKEQAIEHALTLI